jgi:hypothetical protein
MQKSLRESLTRVLREHVAKIAVDLRAKMRDPEQARARAMRLHADEKVGEDFDVWTDLLSRRAAVLWVLKSVYVRVLEDRGLLSPGRLLDPEAQQLFERLAPHLGETAFLRWVYRDLASAQGGVPELFGVAAAEVAVPSDELSRALIGLWRARDPDTGAHWSFAEERFEGELMGDLYQDLDPVVKSRYALCQTPDFVRAFILDRTLTPAIETFEADQVRLLDPACGSGHFLIDGLKRLVEATRMQHPEWERRTVVHHALGRVVGMDINDYACALARTRLVMTAAELAGVTTLAETGQFHPHVYWADALEQVERGEETPVQTDLFGKVDKPRAMFTRSDVRAVLRGVFAERFHAVVANPPYITEKDPARKEYHRERVGKKQRYVSAYREYSLASPFTERCFQLAEKEGYVGLITSNNFMKREFGKPLIEKVFAGVELMLVADTSQAYIPFHGTPTVLIFARNRTPSKESVRAVMGKRRESGTPEDAAKGKVWSGLAEGWNTPGFESEYVSVADILRETLGKHPWSLGGGGAAELKALLEHKAEQRLATLVELPIGRGARMGSDSVLVLPAANMRRMTGSDSWWRPILTGDTLRDWSIGDYDFAFFPYDPENGLKARNEEQLRESGPFPHLWKFRTLLGARATFQGHIKDAGLDWFEYMQYTPSANRTPLSITFAFGATHNHFVFDRGGKVFNRHAPVIKLPAGSTEDDHLALLGLLNSSTTCFWMKQVFHPKTHAGQRHHPDPARAVYEFAATGLQACPIPDLDALRAVLVELARCLDDCAKRRTRLLDPAYVDEAIASSSAEKLRAQLHGRWHDADVIREQMVALQEELDWAVYVSFGLASEDCLIDPTRFCELTCPRGARPFERLGGRTSTVRAKKQALSLEEGEVPPVGGLPTWVEETWKRRETEIGASDALQLVETPVFKRAWRDTEQNIAEAEFRRRKDQSDLRGWFADRVERWVAQREAPFNLGQMTAALQDDRTVLLVAEVITGRSDFSLEGLLIEVVGGDAVPQHRFHTYTESGLAKRAAWEEVWALQRREDAGETVGEIPVPPEYSQGSRGKSTDFLRTEYWQLRGKLDVPKERFIAFTEVPGHSGVETLYGWAGWTALQRLKALLALDEQLEDDGIALADRIGLLDSAWRLLPDVTREDAAVAARLKAELQALVGPDGPSRELVEAWWVRSPPPTTRAAKGKRAKVKREKVQEDEDDSEEGDAP